jgi:hypothetical protein
MSDATIHLEEPSDFVTMPKSELRERVGFALAVQGKPVGLNTSDFVTMPIEELRERIITQSWTRPRKGVNLGEPKANARLEDQVYAVLYGRNFSYAGWHLDLEDLIEGKFDGLNLTTQVECMICDVVAHLIGDRLGLSEEQRLSLASYMNGYDRIAEHLAFDNENGISYSDELVDEIAKTAIEAAHDMEAIPDEIHE